MAGDIGCYNLGTLPPFNAQHTMGAMGASIGVLHGMGKSDLPEPAVCTIGDGTFFHSGLPALANMVHNNGKGTVIIMDNHTTAMTGHQDHPGMNKTLSAGAAPAVNIGNVCRSLGVERVFEVDAFNLEQVYTTLKDCADHDGLSVVVTQGPCVFVSRSAKPAYHVDSDKCIACGKCITGGCPANVLSDEIFEKTNKRKASIDATVCIGCDICRQICPTGAIVNPAE